MKTDITIPEIDGRRLRSLRTRRKIVASFLTLVAQYRGMPRLEDVAARSECALRTVYERFQTIEKLVADALAVVLTKEARRKPDQILDCSRSERLQVAVNRHVSTIKRLLPLRSIIREHFGSSREIVELLEKHALEARGRMLAHVALELAAHSPEQKKRTFLLADAIFSVESWERLCGRDGLSETEVRDLWLEALNSIIPTTCVADDRSSIDRDMGSSPVSPVSLAV